MITRRSVPTKPLCSPRHANNIFTLPALAALVFLCGGCTSWSGHGLALAPDEKFRIALFPIQNEVDMDRLSDIETIPEGTEISDGKETVRVRMEKITQDMTGFLETRLKENPSLTVIPVTREDLTQNPGVIPESPLLSAEQIRNLCASLDAQALMTVRLTGYGRLKTRWVVYLIGSGVVEGTVEGLVVGGATRNIWIGLAVGLEEIGQEILTWGGGAYLFNRYYAPVTLEAALYSAWDGEPVWTDTSFDSIDRKALKKLPEEEQKKKEVQLRLTAEKTLNDLAASLEKAVKKHLPEKR